MRPQGSVNGRWEWMENLTTTHIAGTIPHDNPVVFIGSRGELVPKVGVEPTLSCENWILSPARLPIPPLRHGTVRIINKVKRNCQAMIQTATGKEGPTT